MDCRHDTPLFTALMLAGAVHGARTLLKNGMSLWRDEEEMFELQYLALLIVPITGIIGIHAVVYDGWRHLYFVYPAFVLVAIGGLAALNQTIQDNKPARIAAVGVLALSFAGYAYWIIKAHPMQNVYFNVLAGKRWKEKFDVDYWGLGNRMALESIAHREGGADITIKPVTSTPLDTALLSVPHEERNRFVLSPSDSRPEFVLTNYRMASRCEGLCDLSDYEPYYQKKVDGELILSVFRLRTVLPARTITDADRPYTAEEFRHLSIRLGGWHERGGQAYIDLKIDNSASVPIAARSSVGSPVRVSWRYLDAAGAPAGAWVTRQDLPHDVPAFGSTTVEIPMEANERATSGSLQVSLLQEGQFWGYEVGVAPATMEWSAL
jgi:hypothetical protein